MYNDNPVSNIVSKVLSKYKLQEQIKIDLQHLGVYKFVY